MVDLFGVDRCMFGSHLPISDLSSGFDRLYQLYDRVLAGCTETERDAAYGATTQQWFRVPHPVPPG